MKCRILWIRSRSRALFDPTAHAELLLISEYCRKSSRVYLRDYSIVCSAEPCVMCAGAIKWAKLKRVVYGVPQSYIRSVSGGMPKPGCESILATGASVIEVIGGYLAEEGKSVFDGFRFIPKDRPPGNTRFQ